MNAETLSEYLVYGVGVLRRRWLLLITPVVLACGLSALALHLAPTTYVAKSLILMQGANRNTAGYTPPQLLREIKVERVRAIEAWAKSDEVLLDIVPRVLGAQEPLATDVLAAGMGAIRGSLKFELVGSDAIEVSLSSREREGLGNRLEIIIARIMEGLTGPERSIVSAPQLVLLRYGEQVKSTEEALNRAIEATGLQNTEEVKAALRHIWQASYKPPAAGEDAGSDPAYFVNEDATARMSAAISDDAEVVRKLVQLYGAHQAARDSLAEFRDHAGGERSSYIGIFEAPNELLIIGRPKDPVQGESSVRKLVILGLLLSVVGSVAIVAILEALSGVLRTRGDYERVSGLPVVARLARCANDPNAAA